MRKVTTILLALTLTGSIPASSADNSLDAAIGLYLSASYEEALAALGQLSPGADPDQADKYRALCLLGLNRPQEAAEAIERLVTRKPLLHVDESDSPKLVQMYRETQARLIPTAAKTLYTTAKQDFEQGDIATAASGFRDVLALIAEVHETHDTTLADLKLLAEGFGKLADQQLAAARPSATPVKAGADSREDADKLAPANERPVSKIYDASDPDVAPPIAVMQKMPPWSPRDDMEKKKYSGTVEIVIDENGSVASAAVTAPVYPSYDQRLLQAARSWRYKPARKGGQAVKYRRAVAVMLTPPAGSS
jgi:TonB family protein